MSSKATKRRHRRRAGGYPDLTSFSDIAFLLIIYFILATSFNQQTGLKTDIPAGQQATEAKAEEKTVMLRKDELFYGDQAVTFDQLRGKLTELKLPDRTGRRPRRPVRGQGRRHLAGLLRGPRGHPVGRGRAGHRNGIGRQDPMRRRRRKKRAGRFLVPTTSMGDIAFLLIIFFILCSTKKAGITVTPPTSTGLEALPKPTIYVAIDKDAKLWLDGTEVASADQIETGVSARLANIDPNAPADKRTVIFECDKTVPKETFEPVLEAIAKTGAIIAAVGTERKAQAAGPGK